MTTRVDVEVIEVTQFVQNCMLLRAHGSSDAVLVDPGGDWDRIASAIARLNVAVTGILLTHGHIDHVGGLSDAVAATNAPVWLHPDDLWLYSDPPFGMPSIPVPDDATHIADGDIVEVAGLGFRVLHTPGHSPGHVCFDVIDAADGSGKAVLIGGDLIFFGSVGRTDLPRGDMRTLVRSVADKVWTLPDETTILPGHGPATTVGQEKQINPFVGLNVIGDLTG